jgi:hypothetical protein
MVSAVRVSAAEGIHTGPKTQQASLIADHSRAREALRRSVLSEVIRCVCLEGFVIDRRRQWVVNARVMM